MISIINQTKAKINEKMVQSITTAFLSHYHKEKWDVSIIFVGDKRMTELNTSYRKKNKPTDVLSFIYKEDGLLGEIIIDYAQIKRQAPEFARSTNDELAFILVHGLLHLIGYTDDTEKDRLQMIRLGEKILQNFNNSIPNTTKSQITNHKKQTNSK